MLRVEASIRPGDEAGLRVYDIFHVWPDGYVKDGVRWTSNLFVFLSTPSPEKVRVRLSGPGIPAGAERVLDFNEEWWVPSGGFGLVSAVAERVGKKGERDELGFPLRVFWELSAGKAA